jgi:hypothetical protein
MGEIAADNCRVAMKTLTDHMVRIRCEGAHRHRREANRSISRAQSQ